MFSSFRVQNFRGFRDLQLENLARVNLIGGRNNTGKSALLEAILTYTGDFDPFLLYRVPETFDYDYLGRLRGPRRVLLGSLDPSGLFHNFDVSNVMLLSEADKSATRLPHSDERKMGSHAVEISVVSVENLPPDVYFRHRDLDEPEVDEPILKIKTDSGEVAYFHQIERLRIRPKNDNERQQRVAKLPATFLRSHKHSSPEDDAQRFSALRLSQQDDRLQKVLRAIEARFQKLELLSPGRLTLIHGYLDGLDQPVPLTSMGDGIRRITSLMLAIATTKDGIVLIDEIENGLHHSVQVEVWRAIASAASAYNVQVFATTHSYEMIQAAHEAFQGKELSDFRLLRLSRNRDNNEIRAVSYDEETLDAAIEAGFEVR